uniref:Uncharacterized protein n=1 Tax=Macaca fascicularis TaxID=9541 RepID=A0A7N9CJB8_MACFA
CFRLNHALSTRQNYIQCLIVCQIQKNICRVHVHNVQICYISILVPCCCAAPINSSSKINSAHTTV